MLSVLIIGFGNSLRTDDGVGRHIAEELTRAIDSAAVQIISCATLTPDLAEPISRAGTVIFIDAARHGQTGKAKWQRILPEPGDGIYSHRISPGALLALARDLYSATPEAILLTIPGESFAFGHSLSPAVAACVPDVIALVQQLVAEEIG